MNAIAKAVRLDRLRMTANGMLSMLVMAALPPAFVLLLGGFDGVSIVVTGVIEGMLMTVPAALTMNLFVYEDQNNHRQMNAIVPIARQYQVVGRYLIMAVVDVCAVMDFALCIGLTYVVGGGTDLTSALVGLAVVFGGSIVMESILLPLMYRFSSAEIVLLLMVGLMLVVFALCALALLFKAQVTAIVACLGAHVFVLMPLTVPIGVAFVAIVVAASLSISLRIYLRKEL